IGETYSMMWDDDFTTTKYLLSHLIRPLLVFLPFIIIVCYVRKERDIKKVIYSIIASIFLLSVTILVLYIFATPNKMNFEHVRAGFGKAIGMHGNNIADFYIAVYPMLLAYTVSKKNLFLTVTTVLSVISIAIIYSRSAYAVVIISTLAFYLVSGRKKWIPLFITAAALGYSIIPETVIERALTGFGGEGLNEISAGRTGDIWIPLFMEFSANPVSIFIGAGRYAVMGTEAFKDGIILKVGHAHSMYFDTLFDSGIIGLGFFIIFFWMLLKKFIESHRTIGDKSLLDLMYGIEISVFAFLIRGITDSFFFPTLTNSFLWITLGLGTAIVYSGKKRDEDMEGQEDKGEAAGDSFISPIQSEVYYDEEYSSNSKQP
ncbi:MAG: O-antigen ligase family protein, partial [Bacillota bacterium]